MSRFQQILERQWSRDLLVCVGLDSDVGQLPACLRDSSSPQLAFNERVIESTFEAVCAYKLNLAFYLENGADGIGALAATVDLIRKHDEGVLVILDAKFGDIGNTNDSYARFAFNRLGVDAVTLNPYVGGAALACFLEYSDRGAFVLSRTSNPGSQEFQGERRFASGGAIAAEPPLYEHVAAAVAKEWNKQDNCGLVVGATTPAELQQCRALVGDLPILVPGIGAQGGDLVSTLVAGLGQDSVALLINASRSVVFASPDTNFAAASRQALDDLNIAISRARRDL
jgi:orotidine-5'-phosphate decarboxylase